MCVRVDMCAIVRSLAFCRVWHYCRTRVLQLTITKHNKHEAVAAMGDSEYELHALHHMQRL